MYSGGQQAGSVGGAGAKVAQMPNEAEFRRALDKALNNPDSVISVEVREGSFLIITNDGDVIPVSFLYADENGYSDTLKALSKPIKLTMDGTDPDKDAYYEYINLNLDSIPRHDGQIFRLPGSLNPHTMNKVREKLGANGTDADMCLGGAEELGEGNMCEVE